MLISMVYTFTNEMQITFFKSGRGVIFANEALCVQYNEKQDMILIYRKKNSFAFLCLSQFNK